MGSRHDKDKDKGVNVQVLLRCRPFSEEELRTNAPQVISCHDQRREVTVCQNIASKQIDRTFTFDKVFGPQSQQRDLYEQAVVPIVHEMLEGFNCTIFAYGQTGTGKTYTMEGTGRKTKNGELPVEAGVIPRSVQQIFDTLESQNAEYSVKVTFLELYNEEITDLLAPEDFSKSIDDKQRKPLALMEDGKGGVLVRGLEEEIVTSAMEIYTLLDRGSAKRRTAETLLNKQSSRSHSILTITIHIKEATPEGEELIKCGKLNLVDLAGSENISRSGAREGRAREAGEINKSLLTLGRVITALVEHLAHVPYRDSKLTRLLRDSLGGRTKTCIIATVSPSVHCLEETLSTLDYAHRAKNIRNKPEVNQKMMKSALIKDLYGEIEKLKAEVFAAREKNGIYVPRDRFFQDEAEKKAMAERIEGMEYEIEAKDKQLEDLQELCESQRQLHIDLTAKLDATQKSLELCQEALLEAKDSLKHAKYTLKEQEFIMSTQQQAETALAQQASDLRFDLETTVQDVNGLFAKLDRKDKIEAGNRKLVQDFQSSLAQQMQYLHDIMVNSMTSQQKFLRNMESQLQSFLASKDESVEELKKKLSSLKSTYFKQIRGLQDVVHAHETTSSATLHNLNSTVSAHSSAIDQLLANAVQEAEAVLKDLQSALCEQQRDIAAFAQQQREASARSMETTRIISEVILTSLKTLQKSASEFMVFMEANSSAHDKSLAELAEFYEEEAKKEKTQLLEGIAEMLSNSMARKVELVHSRVKRLRETSTDDVMELKKGVVNFQEVAVGAQGQLESFMKSAEDNAVTSSTLLAAKHCQMEILLQKCVKNTTSAGEHWIQAQESLQLSERTHVPLMASIVMEGLEANQLLNSQFQHRSILVEADVDMESNHILSFVDDTRQQDQTAAAELQSIVDAQSCGAAQFECSHSSNIAEMQHIADQSFNHDYLEDQTTCTTPKKRAVDFLSQAAINSLRTPAIESLQQEFRVKNSPSDLEGRLKAAVNGKVVASADLIVRDFRIPLTTIN